MRQLILVGVVGVLVATPSFAQSRTPATTIPDPVAGCEPMDIGPVYTIEPLRRPS